MIAFNPVLIFCKQCLSVFGHLIIQDIRKHIRNLCALQKGEFLIQIRKGIAIFRASEITVFIVSVLHALQCIVNGVFQKLCHFQIIIISFVDI